MAGIAKEFHGVGNDLLGFVHIPCPTTITNFLQQHWGVYSMTCCYFVTESFLKEPFQIRQEQHVFVFVVVVVAFMPLSGKQQGLSDM